MAADKRSLVRRVAAFALDGPRTGHGWPRQRDRRQVRRAARTRPVGALRAS